MPLAAMPLAAMPLAAMPLAAGAIGQGVPLARLPLLGRCVCDGAVRGALARGISYVADTFALRSESGLCLVF